ncbi:MAG: tRNA lysidine(34) synthetase TilS, partial [Muribaculaceae bacterium]|nr:tRNA lysidine(34) synthetase TilS [Muribaculaceae bacterium]
HAEGIASHLGCDIRVMHFNVDDYRKLHGGSTEMACRELRYRWFAELKTEIGAQAVAVAHNSDDNTETFFLNLLRGTSIAGLTCMSYKSGDSIIRPMLGISRAMIEAYVCSRGLAYVTDSTNLTNDYKRNCIRNVVLPAIRKYFPQADTAIGTTIRHLTENESLYRESIRDKITPYIRMAGDAAAIDVGALCSGEPHHAALILYEWLRNKGLTHSQAVDIAEAPMRSGAVYPLKDATLLLDRGILSYYNPHYDVALEDMIDISVIDASDFTPTGSKNEAYFDEAVLNTGMPITIRAWKKGDRMRPFGMRGSKKLSDLFSDAKIPVDMKARIPVVTLGEVILWVAGVRASSHYPVTSSTRRIVRMRLKS